MSELKPCPFCGCAAIVTTAESGFEEAVCDNAICPISPRTGKRGSKQQAITAWNTRATPTGTIITKDETSRPPNDKRVVMQFELYGRKDGKFTVKWSTPEFAFGRTLSKGDCWWPIDNMFQPPTSGDK